MDAQLRSSNVLLSRLPEREFERLAPALEPISVARREVIGQPGGFIEFVHFPLTAVRRSVCPSRTVPSPRWRPSATRAWSGSRCSWVTSGRRIS